MLVHRPALLGDLSSSSSLISSRAVDGLGMVSYTYSYRIVSLHHHRRVVPRRRVSQQWGTESVGAGLTMTCPTLRLKIANAYASGKFIGA